MLRPVNFDKSRKVQICTQYALLIPISKMDVIYLEHLGFDSVLKLILFMP